MFKNLLKIFVFAVCLSASLSTYALAELARKVEVTPVGWWQAEGNAHDFVGATQTNPLGNHPGIARGVIYAPGHYGRAFHFEGDGFVEIGPAEALWPEKMTLLAYVKADAPPGPIKYIVSQGASSCDAASYGLYTGLKGGLVFYIWDGVHNVNWSPDTADFPDVHVWDGKYHFVAGTYDGTTVRLYVDGNQVGSGTSAPGPIAYNLPDDNRFYIGSYNPYSPVDCGMGFTGEIDEIILLDRALSSAEVHGLLDSDGDGLPDDWEEYGLHDASGNMIIPLHQAPYNADKNHKDIFVQIDYMDCNVTGGDCMSTNLHSHKPKQAAIDMVTEAFRNAPVMNPDGTTGITLHVEVGKTGIPHQNSMRPPNSPGICGFEFFRNIKKDNFDAAKRGLVYHYAVFGHQQESYGPISRYQTVSGCGEQPGNDFMVTLGAWNTQCVRSSIPGTFLNTATLGGDDIGFTEEITAGDNGICETKAAAGDIQIPLNAIPPYPLPLYIDGDNLPDPEVGTVLQQAGTFMHELGHNLGLGHGGGDEYGYKPNYLSVMNYAFQMSGISTKNFLGRIVTLINYSREELPMLAEVGVFGGIGLDETAGIGDGLDHTKYFCPANVGFRRIRTAIGDFPIDWNCNGIIETHVSADVNGDNKYRYLFGFDDWQNLKLDFQNTTSFASGVGQDGAMTEELDFSEALKVPQIPSVKIMSAIDPRKYGVIPVAILSDDLFDAMQVDPLSVRFGPGGATEVHGRGHAEDVDGDGRLDMVLHFATNESGITCGQTSVTLTGTTLGGQFIEGSDDITTAGCKK